MLIYFLFCLQRSVLVELLQRIPEAHTNLKEIVAISKVFFLFFGQKGEKIFGPYFSFVFGEF